MDHVNSFVLKIVFRCILPMKQLDSTYKRSVQEILLGICSVRITPRLLREITCFRCHLFYKNKNNMNNRNLMLLLPVFFSLLMGKKMILPVGCGGVQDRVEPVRL